MNPALIAGEVVDPMGNDHAAGEAGEIMIKGFECLATVDLPVAIERSQVFLFLGIDTQDRVARSEKFLDEIRHMAKLFTAMRRVATGQHLGNLPPGQAKPIENASYDARSSIDSLGLQTVGNLLGGRIRPLHVLTHGVTCSPIFDSILDLLDHVRVFFLRLFPSASGFADAMFGGISGQLLDLAHAFFDGVWIASQDVGDVADPPMAEFDRFDGRKAAAVLFRDALVVLPQELFNGWRVGSLKGKHQEASSISPSLQGRG